jgi:hypothetical protein
MQNEKMQINLAAGMSKAEVIVREVSKVNELEVKAPVKINLNGVLGCVYEFLLKRKDQSEQIFQKRCHIIVNREKISIKLVFNEHDEYQMGTVSGTLTINSKFNEFGINADKVWSPTQLGLFFKMNKSFFPDKAENMRLVSELMNFIGTVNSSIERSVKESGDRSDKFEQVVNSNLPKSFKLKIPVFKGTDSENIEVETFAQVNAKDVSFILLSPAANEIMEDIRDTEIDKQLNLIREICPDIAIIEQ